MYKEKNVYTPRMLNELIEKIEVFHAKKISGEDRQKLIIYYRCIGSVEIPDIPQLSEPETRIQKRKGVTVNYSFSCRNAV